MAFGHLARGNCWRQILSRLLADHLLSENKVDYWRARIWVDRTVFLSVAGFILLLFQCSLFGVRGLRMPEYYSADYNCSTCVASEPRPLIHHCHLVDILVSESRSSDDYLRLNYDAIAHFTDVRSSLHSDTFRFDKWSKIIKHIRIIYQKSEEPFWLLPILLSIFILSSLIPSQTAWFSRRTHVKEW